MSDTNIDDISQLPDNSPNNVINHLEMRYKEKQIHTSSGGLLITINPYDMDLKDIYSEESKMAFHDNMNPVPHIYAIAEQAFNFTFQKDCTIIVSGESGSGKTTCTEKIIEYLLNRRIRKQSLFRNNDNNEQLILEKQILALNQIFECFGNARTEINDNSSRFGKLISLLFKDKIVRGARVKTYLLEKSRITHSKYSFNIFYDFLTYYNIFIKNQYIDSTKKVSKNFCELIENLKIFGIDLNKVLYSIVFIVFLGDMEFKEDKEVTFINEENINLCNTFTNEEIYALFIENKEIEFGLKLLFIANFLNKSIEELKLLLFKKEYNICGDFVIKNNSKIEVEKTRDTLAKNTYIELFNYIISMINKTLNIENSERTISILDIYGFENFNENCFEQFCINWANERIQFEFIKDFYENQKNILEAEGLRSKSESFKFNKTLKLIENTVVDLIVEESIIKTNTLGIKIEEALISDSEEFMRYNDPKIMVIEHYAGNVIYQLNNFIEKNNESNNITTANIKKLKGNTVLDVFRKSLNELFQHIESTKVFYIKCIKPSNNKTSNFDNNIVMEQLKATGIINLLDLCKDGFFQNIEKNNFKERYEFIEIIPGKKEEFKTNFDNNLQVGINYYFLKRELFEALERERELFCKGVVLIKRFFNFCIQTKRDKEEFIEEIDKGVKKFKGVFNELKILKETRRKEICREKIEKVLKNFNEKINENMEILNSRKEDYSIEDKDIAFIDEDIINNDIINEEDKALESLIQLSVSDSLNTKSTVSYITEDKSLNTKSTVSYITEDKSLNNPIESNILKNTLLESNILNNQIEDIPLNVPINIDTLKKQFDNKDINNEDIRYIGNIGDINNEDIGDIDNKNIEDKENKEDVEESNKSSLNKIVEFVNEEIYLNKKGDTYTNLDIKEDKEIINLDEIEICLKETVISQNKKNFIKFIKEIIKATPVKLNMKYGEIFLLSNLFIEKLKKLCNNKNKLFSYYAIFIQSLQEIVETENYNLNSYILILTNIINFQEQTNTFTDFGNYLFCEILEVIKLEINETLPGAIFETDFCYTKKFLDFIKKKKKIQDLEKILINFYNLLKLNKLSNNFIYEAIDHILQEINYKTFNNILVLKSIPMDKYKTLNINLNEISKFLQKIDYNEGILNLSHLREFLKVLIYVKSGIFNKLNDLIVLNSVQLKTISSKLGVTFNIPKDNKSTLFVKEPIINFPKICYFSINKNNNKSVSRPSFLHKNIWKIIYFDFFIK